MFDLDSLTHNDCYCFLHQIENKDVLDVFIEHRMMMERQLHPLQPGQTNTDIYKMFPPDLLRRLYVFFFPFLDIFVLLYNLW